MQQSVPAIFLQGNEIPPLTDTYCDARNEWSMNIAQRGCQSIYNTSAKNSSWYMDDCLADDTLAISDPVISRTRVARNTIRREFTLR